MKRKRASNTLRKAAEARLPTRFGVFRILGFESKRGEWVVALVRGNLRGRKAPLVRVHSQCLTGDVFCSVRCDCRAQLELALKRISREGAGVLLYEPQEGRGIGLINKLRAYQWQDRGLDTVEANRRLGFSADHRSYAIAAEVLRTLKLRRVRLLSNNPEKVAALELGGITVVARVPCQPPTARTTRGYLRTKREKLGHLLTV